MASPYKVISVALRADASGYTPVLRVAAGETERFGQKTSAATKTAEKSWLSLGKVAAAGGVAIGLALLQATRSAIDFDAKMRNVASLGGVSERQFKSLSASVLELSKRFPQSASDLASGLYDIASSGFQGAKGVEVLTVAAKAASAGLTSTASSAQAITAVLNAYGLSASKATSVANTLFQTVNTGVITFDQLTGVIGDTVGTAAAATVGIDEVGAAIATMTLSGISAEEAGTSLNRLLQALIQPSAALSKALHEVGYESGAEALQHDKLNVVLGKLNKLSKGNIETLLQWFPEIRAARGELALAANNGLTYARSVQAGSDAQKGAGSLQRAYAEQLKSTQAQIKLLVNAVSAAGIELGTKFLPYITSGIDGLRRLGRDAVPWLNDRLADLKRLGADVGTVIGHMRDEAEPATHALLALGGTAVLGGFTGLLKGAGGFANILGEHPALIHAITIALGALAGVKVFSVLQAGAQTLYLNGFVPLANSLVPIGQRLSLFGSGMRDIVTTGANMTTGLSKVRQSVSGLTAGISNATIAAGALTAAFILIEAENARLDKQASQHVAGIVGSTENVTTRIHKLQADAARLRDAQSKNVVDIGPVHIGLTEGDAKDAAEAHKQLGKVNEELHNQFLLLAQQQHVDYDPGAKNAKQIERQLLATYKLNEEQTKHAHVVKATKAADDQLNISKSKSMSLTDDELQQLIDLENDMAAYQDQMKLLGPTVVAGKNTSVAALKDLADQAKKYIDDVQQSFQGYGDIIAGIGSKADITGGDISKFYKGQITGATSFLADIKKAVAEGLDPQFVARALQAGPEQAGPLLHKIVSDHSGGLIKMVNDSEKALEQINQQAVEAARLTNIAVSAHSKQTADDLTLAMKADQIIAFTGGKATGEQLAKALGISVDDVKRIAKEYGFVLASGINPLLLSIGAKTVNYGGVAGPGHPVAQAEGGYLDPSRHGDTRRDTVPAMLMPGEVVVRRSSVAKFGVGNLLDLNKGKVPAGWSVPGYAGGGFVTPADVPHPPDVSRYGTGVGYAGGASMGYEYGQVVDFVKKQGMAGVGPGTPAQAIAWMKAAIALTGVPMSWLGPLLHRAKIESNYNPRAVNLWDSNARAGHPSEGWMQTIGPTFQHYMLPGHGDIWNPIDNAAAAIRYIQARYGSAFNLPQSGGYAAGGLVRRGIPVHSYDRGGYLPPGLSIAYNGTQRPEPVGHAQPLYLTVKIGDETLDLKINGAIAANNNAIAVEARTR
jgi:TP901 family phage tail tape measure protein